MVRQCHQFQKASSCDGLTGASSGAVTGHGVAAYSSIRRPKRFGALLDSPIKSASDKLRDDGGFSLIELLVAVSILAFAAVTLLESQTQAVGLSSALEQRSLASIVAENRLVLALGLKEEPVPGTHTGSEIQMGVVFNWRETVRLAPGGDLTIVHVAVSAAEGSGELASLTGFRKGS